MLREKKKPKANKLKNKNRSVDADKSNPILAKRTKTVDKEQDVEEVAEKLSKFTNYITPRLDDKNQQVMFAHETNLDNSLFMENDKNSFSEDNTTGKHQKKIKKNAPSKENKKIKLKNKQSRKSEKSADESSTAVTNLEMIRANIVQQEDDQSKDPDQLKDQQKDTDISKIPKFIGNKGKNLLIQDGANVV